MDLGCKNIIKENDHVILKKADKLRLFRVQRRRDIWLEKSKFTLDVIIGQPYGSTFELKDGHLVKTERQKQEVVGEGNSNKGLETEKDNRDLHDLDSNQRLTADEIEQMKKDGVRGDELIEQLIENSSTFQKKTEYAQEKWVKKKKKKHLLEFIVLKPNSRLLCEMHVSKGPSKICNLRIDSLAQILTLGNVQAHSTVAVFDTCLGLVTGAVLERLAGFGKVVSFYYGDSPMKSQLDAYDFPKEVMDNLYHFPLEQVYSLTKVDQPVCGNSMSNITENNGTQLEPDAGDAETEIPGITDKEENLDSQENHENAESITETVVNTPVSTDADNSEVNENADTARNGEVSDKRRGKRNKKNKNKRQRPEDRIAAKESRAKEIEAAKNIIVQKKIDCLIIACKFHPTPIVTALLDFVSPSRQVVVFSQFKEALQDCYVQMRENGGLVSFRLSETWLRNYQILPNRTHPVIQMSGTGGYLLTATTVIKPS